MERIVKAEWLDALSANDPRAERSRRDIQRLNLISGHHRIMARALNLFFNGHSPLRLVELGAGNARFLLSVARCLSHRPDSPESVLVDRANGFDPEVFSALKKLGWNPAIEIADAFDWLRQRTKLRADQSASEKIIEVIITNQFLHQFESGALAEMFRLAANSADVFIALEPRRGFFPLLCSRFVGLVGCGAVTRCDAPISVRAGFTGGEISIFWPDQKNWQLTERRAGLFSHLFIARRKN